MRSLSWRPAGGYIEGIRSIFSKALRTVLFWLNLAAGRLVIFRALTALPIIGKNLKSTGIPELSVRPEDIVFLTQCHDSDASTIYEVLLKGKKCLMKVYHNNGDPGLSMNGRDRNRFRCEFQAYQRLLAAGVCAEGWVPMIYGFMPSLDRSAFEQHRELRGFNRDLFDPQVIFLEWIPSAEPLNCVNYNPERMKMAILGIQKIHDAGVQHEDVYPKNMLVCLDQPDKVVWIDFDISTTPEGRTKYKHYTAEEIQETELECTIGFGQCLAEDQAEGLEPNTKFY